MWHMPVSADSSTATKTPYVSTLLTTPVSTSPTSRSPSLRHVASPRAASSFFRVISTRPVSLSAETMRPCTRVPGGKALVGSSMKPSASWLILIRASTLRDSATKHPPLLMLLTKPATSCPLTSAPTSTSPTPRAAVSAPFLGFFAATPSRPAPWEAQRERSTWPLVSPSTYAWQSCPSLIPARGVDAHVSATSVRNTRPDLPAPRETSKPWWGTILDTLPNTSCPGARLAAAAAAAPALARLPDAPGGTSVRERDLPSLDST
mmetsp:Transcript_15689/g.49282  ORF Transcript_15689/g.49282 Transcript_15689/m.49282 type:complete len:263 (-) Transcript_15689:3757-4545(-)